jgi:outer membrane protease
MARFTLLIMALVLILSFAPALSWAAEKPASALETTWNDLFTDIIGHYPLPKFESGDSDSGKITKLDVPKNWEFDVGMKRFIASHTSYEFGANSSPWTKPLSRLEFPVNTWWLNFDLRRTCPRWSIGAKAGFSVNRNSNKFMKDSDWETVDSQDVLTTYSKSYCDVKSAFLFRGDVDVNISDWLRLSPSLEVRPLFAFQFQRFAVMAHDGVQWNYDKGNAEPMEGNAISFRQDWYTYMIGLRGSYSVNLNKHVTVKLKGEADWGPAVGYNEDHHILRGERFTYEKTSGSSLYFLTGLDMIVSKTITLGIGIDYLWIRTSGTHKWADPSPTDDNGNPIPAVNQSWSDGVHVWSDQLGLMARLSYAF